MPLATKRRKKVAGPKSKIVRGALEGLSDLFTMPKVRQAMVEDALENPEAIDMVEILDIKDPLAFLDEMGSIDNAYHQLYNDTTQLQNFSDDFLDEVISFVDEGTIPEDKIAKSMVESLFDSGLKEKEARFFMDAAIRDVASLPDMVTHHVEQYD